MSASAAKKRRRDSSPAADNVAIDLSADTPIDITMDDGEERKEHAADALPMRAAAVLGVTDSGTGQPSRKAKSEASQRVRPMAVSLQDDSEVGGKRGDGVTSSRRSTRTHAPPTAASSRSAPAPAAIPHDDNDDDVQILDATAAAAATVDEEPAEEPELLEEAADEASPEEEEEERKEATTADAMETSDTEDTPVAASAFLHGKRAGSSRTTPTRAQPQRTGQKGSTRNGASSAASSAPSRQPLPRAAVAASIAAAAAAASSSSFSSTAPASTSKPSSSSKKTRDMRRDKRISGFGPWKVVHKTSIPAMTFEGYEDLATETLEEETAEAIKASGAYSPQGIDCYHYSPWNIIHGIDEMPLNLMRRVDTRLGREEWKVKASRNIEKKEVVSFLGGRLMERVKANKQNTSEWNQHFHMKKEWLKEFFEYPGAHDLVVSTKDHKCISSYIRAPEDRDDEEEGANLKNDVVFDAKSGLFIVIFFALEKIRRGQEVFCMPFLGQWQDRSHREMFLYSRISHYYHKWAKILELNLLSLGVEFDETLPSDMKPHILTADEEEQYLHIPGMDQGALPEPLPMETSMRVVSMEEAMAYCKSEYSPKAVQKGLSAETQHYIDAVGDFIPNYLEIKGPLPGQVDEDGNPVIGVNRIHVDREVVLKLIEEGYRADCLELREELGIHSPVRHFTPPCYRAFCVVATAPIPQGSFIFCYAGVITEEVENRDSAYVYTIEQEQVRRTVRSYHGPDLTLDALKVGNISRFINDNTYRMGESDEKGSTANLETQFLFLKGSIHLGFYTTRDVAAGEELVSQYGEDYWRTINKQLISEHKKFYNYINPYTRKLEKLTLQRQEHLPNHPPSRWTGDEELFTDKALPYPQPLDEADDDEQDDGNHEVERILQTRVTDNGVRQYKVKWKHSGSAENSWISEKNIISCAELIEEFKESERNKHGGGHSSHSKKHASHAKKHTSHSKKK